MSFSEGQKANQLMPARQPRRQELLPMIATVLTTLFVLSQCSGDNTGPAAQKVFTPSGIDTSGTEDVTAALNQFLRSVPDNSIICFPANARYRIEGTLLLENRHGLTIEGNGVTFFAKTDGSGVTPPRMLAHKWPRSRQHWLFVGGSNIVIRNLTVVGANPHAGSAKGAYVAKLEGQHGFRFVGVQGVELNRVTVTDVYGDLLYLGRSGGQWSRSIHVHDSHFERSGRQGIAITGAEDVLIENSYIGEVGRSIIDLEPNSVKDGARKITFRNNTFGPCRHLFLASGGPGPNVGDVTLEESKLAGMRMTIVVRASDGARRGPIRILNNVSDTTVGTSPMRFVRIDGLEVRGNVQPMAELRRKTGVHVSESCDIVVQENDFAGAVREAEIEPYSCTTH